MIDIVCQRSIPGHPSAPCLSSTPNERMVTCERRHIVRNQTPKLQKGDARSDAQLAGGLSKQTTGRTKPHDQTNTTCGVYRYGTLSSFCRCQARVGLRALLSEVRNRAKPKPRKSLGTNKQTSELKTLLRRSLHGTRPGNDYSNKQIGWELHGKLRIGDLDAVQKRQ